MRIAIASDHAAVDLKTELRDYLIGLGHEVADLGPVTADRVDYPDYDYKLATVIADGTAERAVDDPYAAALSREHNDANVIAMGARLIGGDMAKACLDAFLSTPFGGGRHSARVDKLSHPPA
jgi:ribose 5-phosphate isomerase B